MGIMSYNNFQDRGEQKTKKMSTKVVSFLRDHFYLLFKSAAHNHLRIERFRLNKNNGIECSISFNSYTALKHYQKKVRMVSFGLSTSLAVFLVGLVMLQALFNARGTKAA